MEHITALINNLQLKIDYTFKQNKDNIEKDFPKNLIEIEKNIATKFQQRVNKIKTNINEIKGEIKNFKKCMTTHIYIWLKINLMKK